MMFDINNAIELDDDGLIETDDTEFDMDSIITVQLSDVIHHYRDDITFGKVDFMPCDAKTGAYDSQLNTFDWNSNEVFNKFIHTYNPNYIVDQSNYLRGMFNARMKRACVVLEGEEGCGKNIAFEILNKHAIGTRYCLETPKMKILIGRFNSARENKILTVLNEAANVKQSSHEDQDELKDCTEPTCMIEKKSIDPNRVKDCNNLLIAFNNSYSVKASKQMRRFLYLLCKSDRLGDKAYFKAMLDEFDNTDSGIHLHHYLININLDRFHPQNDAPMTKEKYDM
ncbi:unnamed protein product [Phytophthora lilii]|uniref:Unnamed protein product n=1 Tax=Phytophthora lilii TaxID=2077276 RepID=A0A9W7CK88_9STRA|nr:unnamed protein product [Phytophthora lilii]